MDPERLPHIDLLPIVDKFISAALWVGRLLTRQVAHDPTDQFSQDTWSPVQREAADWMDRLE